MSNHHYEYATSAFGAVNSHADAKFNEDARADALIQATLSLAYEQRTANLIALMSDAEKNGVMAEVDYADVAKQINKRMGL